MQCHVVVSGLVAVAIGFAIIRSNDGLAQDAAIEKQVKALYDQGMALRKAGKLVESIPYFEKAADLAQRAFDDKSETPAQIDAHAGNANYSAGKLRAAEIYFRRSLKRYEAVLSKDDVRLARALNSLGITLSGLGQYQEAEALETRGLAIYQAKLPKNDLTLALAHSNLGMLYFKMARFENAEANLKQTLEIRELRQGKEHIDLAVPLDGLSAVCHEMGDRRNAEVYVRRSLEIRRKTLGEDHVAVADSLNMLGLVCGELGRIAEAEKHLRRALALREKHLSKDDPKIATVLSNLGLLFLGTEREAEAESRLRGALAIYEKAFGPSHPHIATTLNNLGMVMLNTGQEREAERLWRRALEVQERALGKEHPHNASTLTNLAGVLRDSGRSEEAEAMLRRAVAILEKAMGEHHRDVATALNNLALLYRDTKRLDTAEQTLVRVLKMQEAAFSKNHARVAGTRANLATVYRRQGKLETAEAETPEAVRIFKTDPFVDKAKLSASLQDHAELLHALKRNRDALVAHEQSLTLQLAELNRILARGSEASMSSYLETKTGLLPILLNLVAQSDHDASAEATFTWTLRFKGAGFDTLCRLRQIEQISSGDADLEEKLSRYRAQRKLLAKFTVNPPEGLSSKRVEKVLDEMRSAISQLEQDVNRTLARKAPELLAERTSITADAIRRKLGPGDCLIEFCRAPLREFSKGEWLDPHYFAFVVTADGPIRMIDLGRADKMEAGVEAVRTEFADFQEKLRECETVAEARDLEKAGEKRFKTQGTAMYRRLIAPLDTAIGKKARLLIAPDSALHRLPFESLVDGDGKYVIERFEIAYLSTGRDLLRTPVKPAPGTVVIAGPDFKLSAAERSARVDKLLPMKASAIASGKAASPQLRSAGWKALPGDAAEAKDIVLALKASRYHPVRTYVGPEALEEVLKAMPSRRILHLATHGFYLDREPAAPDANDGVGSGAARARLKQADNPLLRSGIVLAGANTVGNKDAADRVEDGWGTAEEIALLNLRGTDLVVLSACQTGLGDIKSGEGVYGLRRAFIQAGARTLVTSLFEVPDAETRELMQHFYAGINRNEGKLRALDSARRNVLAERRKSVGAAHPFFWASFVLIGDPD